MSLVVERAVGIATVQDLGRRGHMHEAVPPGGALVRELLVAANRAADNRDDAAAVEVLGELVVRTASELLVAIDGEPRMIPAGEELVVASGARRCCYLAVRGGLAVPRALDGCGTLLCAGLGAPLRTGDTLTPARAAAVKVAVEPFVDTSTIHVVPGPDLDAFPPHALDLLTSARYRILPSSDRVGTRLGGDAVARLADYRESSRPMVVGAIEVPRDGQPIVLGPEHPTTGGYPILAVIATAELGRLFAIRLGGTVQLALSAPR